ncbi:MAG: hypothetical protein NG747_13220 [Candidatus Brocadia sp.]|nr:hypothetical protein [Candidatus Brocadia sp.]
MANKNTKHLVLKALFAEAAKYGISQETLREDIAPGVIGKRLSKAKVQEVARVLDHIRELHSRDTEHRVPASTPLPPAIGGQWKRYESSRAGLLKEISDLAIMRFGQEFIVPLNNLCARFGESDGYRKMRVSALKELKRRLKELQRDDPWEKSL